MHRQQATSGRCQHAERGSHAVRDERQELVVPQSVELAGNTTFGSTDGLDNVPGRRSLLSGALGDETARQPLSRPARSTPRCYAV